MPITRAPHRRLDLQSHQPGGGAVHEPPRAPTVDSYATHGCVVGADLEHCPAGDLWLGIPTHHDPDRIATYPHARSCRPQSEQMEERYECGCVPDGHEGLRHRRTVPRPAPGSQPMVTTSPQPISDRS